MYSHIQDIVYGLELPLFVVFYSLSLTHVTHILFMSYVGSIADADASNSSGNESSTSVSIASFPQPTATGM